MGIGSFLSRFIARGLVARFISIELIVGRVGGRAVRARRRDGGGRKDLVGGRQPTVRGRGDPCKADSLPAYCPDPLEGRHTAVPELAPAVQLARRVSLSRGAGASWPVGD